MRVIAGERKGFQLKGPAGKFTRPMADKIKGSLFSMLASLGVEPERVLDLYAGTGGIGIEALSRGAETADFVEQNAAAAAVVRANLAHTRYADVRHVYQESVTSFLARAERNPRGYRSVRSDHHGPALCRPGAGRDAGAGRALAIGRIGHDPGHRALAAGDVAGGGGTAGSAARALPRR